MNNNEVIFSIVMTILLVGILFKVCSHYIASELAEDIVRQCRDAFITEKSDVKARALHNLKKENSKLSRKTLKILSENEEFKAI